MAEKQDLYATLGIERGASEEAIRKAYRRLARQFHPDVNPGDKRAEERFKAITAAHEVLANPQKRRLYDEFGEMGLREGFDANQARAHRQYQQQGFGGQSPFGARGAEGFDFSSIFGDIFSRGGPQAPQRRRGRDLLVRVDLPFEKAIIGTEITVQVPSQARCAPCHGTGSSGPNTLCFACEGTGRDAKRQPLTVRIPPGAEDGSKLRVAERGVPGMLGGAAGNLILEIHVQPHPYFRREGLDLHVTLPLTLPEAYSGARIEIPTPSGSVQLRVPPRTQQGTRLRLRGKGVQRGQIQGDLYVTADIRMPDADAPQLEELLAQTGSFYENDPRATFRLES